MSKYTDRMDESLKISLYEQGCIRDPKTHKTIMMVFHHRKERHVAVSTYISEQDVIDALEEVNETDPGFFDYIGENFERLIYEYINNEDLSYYIASLNDYNGWFNNNLIYEYKKMKLRYCNIKDRYICPHENATLYKECRHCTYPNSDTGKWQCCTGKDFSIYDKCPNCGKEF